ncbi:DUF6541 family protein [Actinomycetospora cinnamomea]|uniref:4-amino-4-deoxy-L-arabinose transferase-like glycosyltransferase n=1 Tax=Actinomycetospora cinnamomea TaxID=663609 RepID=A0A2U1FBN6_9PSEU|nr:DUF6541 family protein [Actinomycetospora cinnamomea]PVZ09539.1 hypothetical protein C8D89_106203 [Actinomycetospora cinnamomea]
MTFPLVTWGDVGIILLYVVVLWLPGLGALLASGSRGWTALAVAPLATYGIAGVAGPVSSGLGLPWSPLSLLGAAVLTALLGFSVRRLTRRWADPDDVVCSPWSRVTTVGVGLAVAVAALIGAGAVLGGIRRLTTIPQDWDAAFHANGIAWIARTGDGGLTGMSQINWYGSVPSPYYPNAYHLIGASISDLTGRDIPSILNAHTLLIPGILALGIAALCHRLGTRGLLAAASAVVAVGISSFYDMLWRGPLLPFAAGVALIPALLVVLIDYLAAPRVPRRLPTLVPLALGACGLYALHPGAFIAAAPFAAAMIASSWLRSPRRIPGDLASLGIAAVVAVAALLPHLLSSLASVGEGSTDWPEAGSAATGVGEALLFSHAADSVQVWFVLLLLLGALCWLRLDALRWIVLPGLLFVGLFVAAFASDAPIVEAVTRPWWNDRFRLIGVATIPLCVLVGHGLQQVHDAGIGLAYRMVPGLRARRYDVVVGASTAGLLLVALVGATGGDYLARNQALMTKNTGEGPAVSSAEVEGFRVLGSLVRPGERVMNDTGDGSVWMYALGGALPVAGHYNQSQVDPDVTLLSQRFDEYATAPAVRAAAERLDVRWVVLGQGFLREGATRQPGLDDLGRVPSLQLVYQNPDFVIYRLTGP